MPMLQGEDVCEQPKVSDFLVYIDTLHTSMHTIVDHPSNLPPIQYYFYEHSFGFDLCLLDSKYLSRAE